MSGSARDVVVAGGGPVGLWLAAELKTAGVDVLVLEKRAERSPHSKALTLYPRTLELFAMRGLIGRWLEEGTPVPSSHYALLNTRLDFSFLDSRYPYTLFFPQVRTEELLEEYAISLGVPVLRGHAVTGVEQADDGVTVHTETTYGRPTFQARYVVGCEGGSSAVRKSAGIEFVGSPTRLQCLMGDVVIREPPAAATVSLNCDGGAFFMVRLGPDLFRMAPLDNAVLHQVRHEPPTLEELRASVTRVAGTDYGMHTARWLTRVGNATLQAARYREGRVLLAGDSAHLFFPLGGQGLNLGLQDATNLAWKLAACVHGWAPHKLLDTYSGERHPVGEYVLADTLAQMALVANTTREGQALRKRFDAILATHTTLNRELATRLSGLAITYQPEGAGEHSLSGQRVPDLELEAAPAASVFGLLTDARFLRLDLTGGRLRLPGSGQRSKRLKVTAARLANPQQEWTSATAVLIRPDGHVAWATNDPDRAREQAQSALDHWLQPETIRPQAASRPAPPRGGRADNSDLFEHSDF
jgi:2-polyprenyl-6-methoxyphenol hydroxylase-like FAD-dependent oxidoreductase